MKLLVLIFDCYITAKYITYGVYLIYIVLKKDYTLKFLIK